MVVLCLRLLLLCLPFCVGQGPPPTGEKQFVLNFDSDVYVCPDEESAAFIDTSLLRAVRHNETTAVLTGAFQFLKDVEDMIVVELIIFKEFNGRYEVAATELICDLCEELARQDEENMYTPFLKFVQLPSECPIPAGSYIVDNMIIDTTDFPINSSNMGRYECAIKFYTSKDENCKERDFLGCIKLDLLIEPLED